jgi:hypothetical protein
MIQSHYLMIEEELTEGAVVPDMLAGYYFLLILVGCCPCPLADLVRFFCLAHKLYVLKAR